MGDVDHLSRNQPAVAFKIRYQTTDPKHSAARLIVVDVEYPTNAVPFHLAVIQYLFHLLSFRLPDGKVGAASFPAAAEELRFSFPLP